MQGNMTARSPRATRLGTGATGAATVMVPGLLLALVLGVVMLVTLAAFHVAKALSSKPVTLSGGAELDERQDLRKLT